MGLRTILLIAGIWILYLVVKNHIAKKQARITRKPPKDTQNMVRCKQCGVHLPISQAIVINDNYYCCEEHSKEQG
jgi:uncharacterized protein